MKRLLCILMVILIFVSLCGCSNDLKKDYIIKYTRYCIDDEDYIITDENINSLIDNTTPYEQLITKQVDIHDFLQNHTDKRLFGNENINEIACDIGIECLRKTPDGAFYSVHKVKQGGLLYIFYLYSKYAPSSSFVLRWYYAKNPLSFYDFKDLKTGKSTLDDVIAVDNTQQVFENLYNASKDFWSIKEYAVANSGTQEGYFVSWQYLEDGIMQIFYTLDEGKPVYVKSELKSDYLLTKTIDDEEYEFNVKIFDIDKLK